MVLGTTSLHQAEGVPAVLARVLVVVPRLSIEGNRLANNDEKGNLGHRQEANAANSGQRVGLAIGLARQMCYSFGEHPSSHCKHADAAVPERQMTQKQNTNIPAKVSTL